MNNKELTLSNNNCILNNCTLPTDVQLIMNTIKHYGGEAYVVGGCVRDTILMRVPHDWDIATNLKLEEIVKIFPKAVIVGKIFGVVKVGSVDISTFRIDGPYSDGRHPDNVMFVNDIVQDLSRRDFTINAIAFDSERYVDPFNGMDAIRRGVIQTVNAAKVRFKEDALRMLRAFRFSSLLGFNIANSTYRAIREMKGEAHNISKERIKDELLKMFAGKNIIGALFSLSASGLLFEIFPDLRQCKGFIQNKYHKYDVLEHTFRVVEAVPNTKPLLRMAALLHDVGKPATCKDYNTPDASFHNHEFVGADMSATILKDLKFSTKQIEYITTMIRCHMFGYRQEMKDSAIRRLMGRVGKERIPDLMLIKYADRVGNGTKEVTPFSWDRELKRHVDKIEQERQALKITDLAITGKDLMEVGIEAGPFLGKLLRTCLDYVLEYPDKNRKEDLLRFVNHLVEEYNKDEVGKVVEKETGDYSPKKELCHPE